MFYFMSESVISCIFIFYSSPVYYSIIFVFTYVHKKAWKYNMKKQTKNLKYVQYNPNYWVSTEKDMGKGVCLDSELIYISPWELQNILKNGERRVDGLWRGLRASWSTKRMIKNLKIKEDFGSVTQSYMTLWDPMDCSTPDFTVLHCLPEYAHTHVLWVSDAV